MRPDTETNGWNIPETLKAGIVEAMAGDETTITPEVLERPTILFLDFPVLTGYDPARLALAMWLMSVTVL